MARAAQKVVPIRAKGPPLEHLMASFDLSLRARRLSPRTVRTYTDATTQFVAFLEREGLPTTATAIERRHAELFLLDMAGTAVEFASDDEAARAERLAAAGRSVVDTRFKNPYGPGGEVVSSAGTLVDHTKERGAPPDGGGGSPVPV